MGLLLVVAVLALGFGSFRAGPAMTTTAATATSTMAATDHGTPVATAAPMPDRPHLTDRRPDRTVDGLVIALAVLLVLGLARRTTPRGRLAAAATTNAGPPPATRAWHRRGPPALHLT